MYILANGKLITRDAAAPYLPDGGVAIDGTRIAAVGATAELRATYPDAEFLDARGGVIMPGLVNAHTHIYSALARGLSINGFNPTSFYEVLDGQWWYIDRHLTLAGTRASADALYLDCIKQGVTTIFDHHASFADIPGSLFQIADSAKQFGIRSCLCYEVSDRDGQEKADQAVQENKDWLDYCEKNPGDMLASMFGGHALFTISDKTFEKMTAANNGRTGFHIHVSEGMNDVYDSLQNYGRRPVQRLQDHGILGPKTILGHCIHVNTAEMEIIQATGTMCVNNPESNMEFRYRRLSVHAVSRIFLFCEIVHYFTSFISKDFFIIRLASAKSFISPAPDICIIRLPIAVASTGPVIIFLPVAFAVSSFKRVSLLPPPIILSVL